MRLPEIGETITNERGIELCRHFGLLHLAERISRHPEQFDSWVFDGCSCVPDAMLAPFAGKGYSWRDITDKCALPHDLKYAYGSPGDVLEKETADSEFKADLINHAGMSHVLAVLLEKLVAIFGAEKLGLDFTWAFARRKEFRSCPI